MKRIVYLLPAFLLLTGCSLLRGPALKDPATDPKTFVGDADIQWKSIGRSVENRPIYYTTFGSGRDVTLLFGAFHGNERGSPFLPLYLAELVKKEPELIKPGKKLVVVPFLNPDGYARGTRRNANDVDLNRNYPTSNWGEQPGEGSKVYFGSAPASEPETKAVLRLMRKFKPTKIITIHQPLACNNNDGPAGLPLAELMARYNKYPVEPYIGYPTPGSYGTYAGKELEIPMVTLELPRGGPGSEELAQMWEDNREALLAVVNYDDESAISK